MKLWQWLHNRDDIYFHHCTWVIPFIVVNRWEELDIRRKKRHFRVNNIGKEGYQSIFSAHKFRYQIGLDEETHLMDMKQLRDHLSILKNSETKLTDGHKFKGKVPYSLENEFSLTNGGHDYIMLWKRHKFQSW